LNSSTIWLEQVGHIYASPTIRPSNVQPPSYVLWRGSLGHETGNILPWYKI